MIEYKYPEEKGILLHYAEKMKNNAVKEIILKGYVENSTEADELASFYWSMVDRAAEDEGVGLPVVEVEGIEAWMEYIFHTLNGYMVSNGYVSEWDKE